MTGPVLFLIPARGGSKGLPGKNVRLLRGIPLVGRTARTARLAAALLGGAGHRVVCSTDDDAIAEAARTWGAEVPFRRPTELATDDADSSVVALHALDWYLGRGQTFPAVALLQCTTPLLTPEDLTAAVRTFFAGDGSSVVTVSPAHHPYWTYRLEGGRLTPVVPTPQDVLRRQDVAECYALNGGAYVIAPGELRETRRFLDPGRSRAVVVPAERGIDVDSAFDLARCEAVLLRQPVKTVSLGGRTIGPGAPCFVIAEAGVNHNGDLGLAHRLVDAAADAGADAVKFQTFRPQALAATDAPLAAYQETSEGAGGSQLEMLKRLALSAEAHGALKAHAEKRGIVFLSSPFDEASADLLERLDVAGFKIPSGEITNLPFLRHVARKGRPMLVSTGMCEMADVAAAVDAIAAAGNPSLALFHCVSNYPAAKSDANLRAMATLHEAFGCPVGWSDHTTGHETALASVALGASLLERHLTLDRTLPGPDHAASLEPAEFRQMVESLRAVESALGTGEKRPQPSELAVAAVARKSLHWRISLGTGAAVDPDHLVALRPGTGISPARLGAVAGRRVARPVSAGALVMEADLENVT